uniref:GTPase Obg n=1 Tax=Desulfobacca acetoxidans TaxID=60893 RepID=A0A7C5ALM5_9BACT
MKSFPDEAEITVQAGKGGPGCVSFRRARFEPRGRPDGGNGGHGGDILLEASPHVRTLAYFRHHRHFRAANGQPGQSQDCIGKSGAPLIITVPLGTLIFDGDTGEFLGELLAPGQRLVVARGGRGGKGNAHFVSSRLRSPRFAQPGEKGETRRLRLELRILAEVGLVGPPNAGKTTLLKALTASRARVGDFPFTTLSPQLGALLTEDEEPLVVAEIPGLIPGAHRGKGLGHRFLRHTSRAHLLVAVLDASSLNPAEPLSPLKELLTEMQAFAHDLPQKVKFAGLNKVDLLPPDFPLPEVVAAYRDFGLKVFPLSALTGEGVAHLKQALVEELTSLRSARVAL